MPVAAGLSHTFCGLAANGAVVACAIVMIVARPSTGRGLSFFADYHSFFACGSGFSSPRVASACLLFCRRTSRGLQTNPPRATSHPNPYNRESRDSVENHCYTYYY